MNTKFWIKTYLYKYTPGGYGYYRYLRRFADSKYVHERDKHPIRHKHYGQEGWKQEQEQTVTYRDYENYDEYVIHQKQKFGEILKIYGGFNNKVITNYRLKFYSRFKHLRGLLPDKASIICLGARQGTEVEVLQDLGFKNAYGIDLNPGPNNPYVRVGDFMKLDNQTSSVDLIYTNCVDHAFNLEDFFAEHARVIKENGYAFYDIGRQSETDNVGPFETVSWENEEYLFIMMLRYFKQVIRVHTGKKWKWILLQGKRDIKQSE